MVLCIRDWLRNDAFNAQLPSDFLQAVTLLTSSGMYPVPILAGALEYPPWMHANTAIQINQPTRCNSFTSLLLDVYLQLNMFRASPRPSSWAYNWIMNLWFYRWSVVVGALLVVVSRPRPTTRLPATTNVCKTRGCNYSFCAPDDERCVARNMLSN